MSDLEVVLSLLVLLVAVVLLSLAHDFVTSVPISKPLVSRAEEMVASEGGLDG